MALYADYLRNMAVVVGWWGLIVLMLVMMIRFVRSFHYVYEENRRRLVNHGTGYAMEIKRDTYGNKVRVNPSKLRRVLYRVVTPPLLIFGIPFLIWWAQVIKTGAGYDIGGFMVVYATVIGCVIGFLLLVAFALYMAMAPFVEPDEDLFFKLTVPRVIMLYGLGVPLEFFAWPALILALNVVGS